MMSDSSAETQPQLSYFHPFFSCFRSPSKPFQKFESSSHPMANAPSRYPILAASSKYFAYRYSWPPAFGCQTFQTPQQLDDVGVVCDPPWTLKFLVFPSGWIWEENIKLPEDVTLRPDVLITLLASSPDWGVKNWKAGTQVLQSRISLPIVGSCII